jgi:hypothetical protein
MRLQWLGLLAILGLAGGSGEALASPPTDDSPRATFDHFIAAFNALDWETFRHCFAESASVFNPDIPDVPSLHRMDGRSAIERSFRAVFDAAAAGPAGQRGPNIHPENVRQQQFGDTGIITFEFKRAGNSMGRRTVVFNRVKGSWLIVHIHASNVAPR